MGEGARRTECGGPPIEEFGEAAVVVGAEYADRAMNELASVDGYHDGQGLYRGWVVVMCARWTKRRRTCSQANVEEERSVNGWRPVFLYHHGSGLGFTVVRPGG